MVEYRWDESLARSYADGLRPMVRWDHRRWAAKVAEHLPRRADLRVLDVATGPGFLLLELGKLLENPTLVGQDKTSEMLVIAAEEARRYGLAIQTVQSPAEALGAPDASFDVVTCKQLLHEADDVDAVIAEGLRVLAPGGLCFLIDFDRDGSRIAALAIRTLLRFQRGPEIASSFWRSFTGGLAGEDVGQRMERAGFERLEYHRAGPNFMMVGRASSSG